MNKILVLAIILFTFQCYGQQYLDLTKNINEKEMFYINIDDLARYFNNSKDKYPHLVSFHGFYFDTDKLHQKSIYNCLPNFNPQLFLFHFQIYNGDLNWISLKLRINNKEKKEELKHSALYIFTRRKDAISAFIEANLAEFSLSRQDTLLGMDVYELGMDVYKLEYISSQEEFCYRLNQIHNQIENELKNISKQENQKQPRKTFFSIGINNALGVRSNLETFSDENITSFRSINPSFFELGITSNLSIMPFEEEKHRLIFTLGFAQSKFGTTTTIKDGHYAIPIEDDFLSERIVSFENVKERASLSLNSFGVGVGYNLNPKDNGWSVYLAFDGRYYLPSAFSTELISGNFSYRGKSPFISQELENINDLNLKNNVHHSFFQPSVSEIRGYAVSPSLQFNYTIANFTFYTGINYLMNFWTIQNPMNHRYLSPSANEYNSTFMLSRSMQNSILSTSFGVSYAIR